MRQAKWVRGVPEACSDDLVFVAGDEVRRSWSLGPLRGKLADKLEKTRAAARADARSVDPFRIGGVCAHLGSMWRRLTVEEKQQTRAGGVFALGGMPQAEVADLVQALGQNVLEEAAHELLSGDAIGAPPVGFAMLVADGDGLVVETDDARVGDRDAEDVAGEIIEHSLLGVAAYAAPVLSTILLVLAGFAPATATLGLACAAIVGGAFVASR